MLPEQFVSNLKNIDTKSVLQLKAEFSKNFRQQVKNKNKYTYT